MPCKHPNVWGEFRVKKVLVLSVGKRRVESRLTYVLQGKEKRPGNAAITKTFPPRKHRGRTSSNRESGFADRPAAGN